MKLKSKVITANLISYTLAILSLVYVFATDSSTDWRDLELIYIIATFIPGFVVMGVISWFITDRAFKSDSVILGFTYALVWPGLTAWLMWQINFGGAVIFPTIVILAILIVITWYLRNKIHSLEIKNKV